MQSVNHMRMVNLHHHPYHSQISFYSGLAETQYTSHALKVGGGHRGMLFEGQGRAYRQCFLRDCHWIFGLEIFGPGPIFSKNMVHPEIFSPDIVF